MARALRETIRHNAVLAHVAGAEFLIADSFTVADMSPLVERVRAAVAATPRRAVMSSCGSVVSIGDVELRSPRGGAIVLARCAARASFLGLTD